MRRYSRLGEIPGVLYFARDPNKKGRPAGIYTHRGHGIFSKLTRSNKYHIGYKRR